MIESFQPLLLATSTFALTALTWAMKEYAAAPYLELWAQAMMQHHIPAVIMQIFCIFVIATVFTRNVTSIGGEMMSTRHGGARYRDSGAAPVYVGGALWALVQLAPDGGLAGFPFGGISCFRF